MGAKAYRVSLTDANRAGRHGLDALRVVWLSECAKPIIRALGLESNFRRSPPAKITRRENPKELCGYLFHHISRILA